MSGIGIGGLVELAMVLTSGFILCAWEPWRSYQRRQPSPIPYFTFLAAGVILWVAVAALIPVLRQACNWSPICLPTFGDMMGFADNQRHGVNVLSSAIIIWIILRFSAGKIWTGILKFQHKSSHHLKVWEFDKMVNEAVSNDVMIMLTLSNRKIYVGRPNQISRDESGRERWISFVPWRSGCRCKNTGDLIWTTDYKWMLQGPISQGSLKFMNMCVPIREVVSFQYFDPSLHEQFPLKADRGAMENTVGDNEGGRAEGSGQSAKKKRSVDFVDTDSEHKQEMNRQ